MLLKALWGDNQMWVLQNPLPLHRDPPQVPIIIPKRT